MCKKCSSKEGNDNKRNQEIGKDISGKLKTILKKKVIFSAIQVPTQKYAHLDSES